jgi:hypothetical protein
MVMKSVLVAERVRVMFDILYLRFHYILPPRPLHLPFMSLNSKIFYCIVNFPCGRVSLSMNQGAFIAFKVQRQRYVAYILTKTILTAGHTSLFS